MNQVGIYFAFWEHNWEADYIRYIEKVSRLGFDILEVCTANLLDTDKSERTLLRRAAEDAGIRLTFCLGTAPEYDMSARDAATRERGIAYAKRTVEMIAELGGDTYGGINYASWPVKTLPASLEEKKGYVERSLESLRQVMKTAEDCGVTYCFEIVNRFEQFLLNTATEGVAFCKALGSPNAKLLLDTFHMNIEEDSFVEAIRTAGSYLGHFHIGEPNRKTPGTGRMPWYEIAKALHEIDYRGAVVMEPFVSPGGQVGQDIRIWRDLSAGADEADLDERAAKACRFMKAVLESTEPW